MVRFINGISLSVFLAMSFLLIILSLIGFALFASGKMTTLSGLTEKLYKHPYTVSTTLRDIKISTLNLTALARTAAQTENAADVPPLMGQMAAERANVEAYFALIKERFLGNPNMVTKAENDYLALQDTLDEIMTLAQAGNGTAATAALDTQKANAVSGLNTSLGALLDFANTKAGEFHGMSGNVKDQAFFSFWASLGGIVAFCVVAAFSMMFLLNKRLNGLSGAMREVAAGNLETQIPYEGTKTEAGNMARSLRTFLEDAIEKRLLDERQKTIEEEAAREKRDAMNQLADELLSSVGNIVQTVSSASVQLNSAAHVMTEISEKTQSQAESVGRASSEAATNVQSVAASTEEMTATFGEINRRMTTSSENTRQAVERVAVTTDQIEKLAEKTETIGTIVKMISEIAEQTNLLALNATIESARAGDAGKGFAVVASEVKELANQTAKATESINEQIEAIQDMTQGAVGSISEINTAVLGLQELSSEIAAAMEEQDTVTQEIARNIQEAASGAEQVSSGISVVSDGAVEAGSSADQVTSAASELADKSEELTASIETFLAKVRAA